MKTNTNQISIFSENGDNQYPNEIVAEIDGTKHNCPITFYSDGIAIFSLGSGELEEFCDLLPRIGGIGRVLRGIIKAYSITDMKPETTYESENIRCPYCLAMQSDSWELGDGGEECDTTECWKCEKNFTWSRTFIITYKGIPTE
jgi:hypothetical protein